MDVVEMPPLNSAFEVDGPAGPVPVVAFDQDHGGVRSLGFRFGPIAYSSDLVDLPEASFEALAGVEVWILDALRWTPHPTHAHVEKALAWIERVKPRRAVLTNLHIDLDYRKLADWLPAGVEPAYDGMTIRAELP
jgi:phosphoribosyl 1,2-cyclic phosphate phosphodiesterase